MCNNQWIKHCTVCLGAEENKHTMAVAGSLEGDAGLFDVGGTPSTNGAVGVSSGGGSADGGSTGTSTGSSMGWSEFCERHARAAASDFAKSCVHYINKNLPENVRTTVSQRDFMMKFVECFSEHYETEFSRRRGAHQLKVGVKNCVYIISRFAICKINLQPKKKVPHS